MFWQQPLQLPGPQVESWQEPAWQTFDGAWFTQFEQSPPPVPQAVSWVPTAQMSPTQQPGQLAVLQLPAVTQVPVPVLQTDPASQATQAAPLIPQDFAVVAMTH